VPGIPTPALMMGMKGTTLARIAFGGVKIWRSFFSDCLSLADSCSF
jgi:hypothetical protein